MSAILNQTIEDGSPLTFEVHNTGTSLGTGDIVIGPIPKCGDTNYPIPTADINEDCIVNLLDLGELAQFWMTDNRPL